MTPTATSRIPRTIGIALVLTLFASCAGAQFEQYTTPGAFEEVRESMEDLLDRSMTEARWRWGRIHMHPWLALRNFSFVDPVTDRDGAEVTDFTASAGAGVRGYAPIGRELTVAFHALPEYVWWQDLDDRRRLNGRYGVGLFGNLGRTGLEITATRDDEARYVSREIEQLVSTRDETGKLALEVDVGRGMTVFGEGSVRRIRFIEDTEIIGLPNLTALEREEEILRGGISVMLSRGLRLGLGIESSAVDFTDNDDRSHSGTAPTLQVGYDASHIFLSVHLAFRDLEAEPGSRFVAYDGVTGSLRSSWKLRGNTELELFGNNNLVYSATERWAYFEDAGLGLGVRTALTRQLRLRLHAEQGVNDYVSFVAEPTERSDEYFAYGGQLLLSLGRVTLTVGASTTDYDSNLPAFERSTTTIRSGLTLGSRGGSPWG